MSAEQAEDLDWPAAGAAEPVRQSRVELGDFADGEDSLFRAEMDSLQDTTARRERPLVLPATLLEHLDVEATADAVVSRGYRPGRKILTVLAGLLAGADCIDDLAVLRAGSTGRILPTTLRAPSTIGTWLRSLTFGHVRQLDRLNELLLTRAWQAGAGPGGDDLVIDVDSTICQVHGYAKQGAAYGYTRQLGYHPLLATRADTGEFLHTPSA
jgi:hypothetical protein